jgi:penicillin-binding protein 1A
VTEALDGAILAMTGGVDYQQSQYNRATQALRQPGSAFKPFVYLAAMESGLDPDTKIDDSPLTEGSYRPDNYDNKYYGEVTLTQALAHSMNTATIRLLRLIGIDRLMDVARRMEFTHEPRPELAAGLGVNEVDLLELTNAYTIIANGGEAVWPYAVLSIKDGEGRILYQHMAPPEQSQAFSHRDINALDGMLQQVVIDGTGKSARLSHGHVAGKTGTTQNYRDALFMGYTDHLVTGVWMGNDNGAPMRAVTGGKYPAQLWRDYMEAAIDFNVPVFVPEAMPSMSQDENEFSDMLSRWSGPRFHEDDDEPVYNQ